MKKLTILMAVLAMVGSNSAFAQSSQNNNSMGKGAAAGTSNGNSGGMAWLVGLGALAVLGTVVGITVATATSSPSSYGH